jgi:ankyrin repeat protein
MELLVEGLLGDDEVFKSLGYESLYESGFLDYDLWKKFQQQKIERDIAALDEAFCAVDDVEETIPSPVSNSLYEESLYAQFVVNPVDLVVRQGIDFGELSQSPLSENPVGVHNRFGDKFSRIYTQPPSAIEASVTDILRPTSLSKAAREGHEAVVRLLLDRGADANAGMDRESTPLCGAARAGHEAVVRLLLDRGADVNAKTGWRHEAVVRLLLDHGAYTNARTDREITPLSEAARGGHEAVVRLLLDSGADANTRTDWEITPLSEAAREGHEAVVRLLLDRGADVNARTGCGSTSLSKAARGGHEAVVRLLLDRGADANATVRDTLGDPGSTPLFEAARRGHDGVVRLLLDRGADANTTVRDTLGDSGSTPLFEAARRGHDAVVRLLLDRGADANATVRDTWGDSGSIPLLKAVCGGHDAVVQLLLDRGADANATARDTWSYRGRIPLLEAVRGGHEAVVRLLLDSGADFSIVDAALTGNEAMVRLLLRHRADANTITSYGTALSAAASCGHDSIVRLLLRRGADVQTAFCFLRKLGHVDSEESLLKTVSGLRSSMGVAPKLRHLRLKFAHQYILMTKAGQSSSTKCRDLAQQFQNHRQAWAASIRAMKSLCKGDRPAAFCDAISFLCLARAIAESLDNDNDVDNNGHNPSSDYVDDFLRDLNRWQELFRSDEEEFAAYAETVYSMWSVVLDKTEVDDDDVLIRFQLLASSLVSQASEAFGLDVFGNNGLERSQHKWRERTGQAPPNRDSPNWSPDLPFSKVTIPQQLEPALLRPPDPPPVTKTKSLREKMEVDISAAEVEPIVVLLMAGAVFAIVIMFLQGTSAFFPFSNCSWLIWLDV